MNNLTKEREEFVQKWIESVVSDEKIVEAFRQVPRHLFVPEHFEDRAYRNSPLPIGYGQTISQPGLVAEMVEMLQLTGEETVLEVGTGSGYQAAILSLLCEQVYSIERIPELAEKSARTLYRLGYKNVKVIEGDGTQGLPERAPFDAIVVAASGPEIPEALIEQLDEGGRIVIPIIKDDLEQLLLGVKKNGELVTEAVHDVRFVPLIEDQFEKD